MRDMNEVVIENGCFKAEKVTVLYINLRFGDSFLNVSYI